MIVPAELSYQEKFCLRNPRSLFKKVKINGQLTLVGELHPTARSVVIGLWFAKGSRFEQKGEFGAYHFLEHLVFKSNKALSLLKKIELCGGEVNAFTAHEHTCFHVTVLAQDLELAIQFLAALVKTLKVKPQDFELEKQVIIQEIKSHHDDIEDEVHRFFLEKTLKGTGLAHSISGSVADVTSLTLADLQKIHKVHYQKGYQVLSIAGQFQFSTTEALIKKYFGQGGHLSLKNENPQGLYDLSSLKTQFTPGVYTFERKTQQLYLLMGFRMGSIFDPQRFAASLFNSWFGQGMMSQLYQKIREELGLVYFIQSQVVTFLDQGIFLIEASSEKQKMPDVIESLVEQINLLHQEKKSASIWNKQKRLMRGQILLAADDFENRMQSVALNQLLFGKNKTPEQFLAELESVTAGDVDCFLKDVFKPENVSVVLYGSDAKKFEPYLKAQLNNIKG